MKQLVPPFACDPKHTVSAGALKSSVSQETVEQVPHAALGLSAHMPFEDEFNAGSFSVRKEGVFAGTEITTSFYLSWI